MQQRGTAAPFASGEERVVVAFRRIWDRSDAHAAAVAKIIAASGDLGPRRIGQEPVP